MKVSLARRSLHHSGFLEQVGMDVAAIWSPLEVERNVHILSKARRIIIATCSSVSKALQNDICSQENIPHPLDFCFVVLGRDRSEIFHHDFRSFCFPRARFARDDNARIFTLTLRWDLLKEKYNDCAVP